MIRFSIRRDVLKGKIGKDWLDRAQKRTDQLFLCGKFDESSFTDDERGFWSELKPVYLDLQRHKCGYCERHLSAKEEGIEALRTVESDLEHYRPKKTVNPWPSNMMRSQYSIPEELALGDGLADGYYLLAYKHLNYLISCRRCNKLKHAFFPIAGLRCNRPSKTLKDYQQEKPYLIYPIGSLDSKPEDLITFEGIRPVPRKKKGLARLRGLATIHLLRLDTRDELLRGRAEAIIGMWFILNSSDKINAARALKTQLSSAESHTSCKRAFRDCFENDRALAEGYFNDAMKYLESSG